MPSAQEIVRQHRQHYLDRKLARNPLLQFFPSAYRLDVCELFRGVQENLPTQKEFGVSTPEALLKALLEGRLEAAVHGLSPALLKKLGRIRKLSDDHLNSTGQHTLYLAYPCVVMPGTAKRTAKLAPVMLFAVSISINVSQQKLTIKRIVPLGESGKDKTPSEAILNRLLAAYVEREFGASLAMHAHRVDVQGENIKTIVQKIFEKWRGLKCELDYPNLSAISKTQINALNAVEDEPYIADYAVLGLAEFSGQALLDDLDQLEKTLGEESCPEGLARLISAPSNAQDSGIDEPLNETEKWLVEKSDPSQEKVVWAQKNNGLIVLQGPPGTGKSQTIVNIIADALAHKKTVMVVCQKLAAIEVVRKRLSARGLGELTVLINDIDKDRASTIKKIRAIENEFPKTDSALFKREEAAKNIPIYENKIDLAIAALNDKTNGLTDAVSSNRMRFGDLAADWHKLQIDEHAPTWHIFSTDEAFKTIAEQGGENLKNKRQEVEQIDQAVLKLRYGVNVWSETPASVADDQALLLQIPSDIKRVNQLSAALVNNGMPWLCDHATRWIAEHPWLNEAAFPILGLPAANPLRESLNKYQELLGLLRKLECINPRICVSKIAHDLFSGSLDVQFLQTVEADAKELRDLLALRGKIEADAALASADRELKEAKGDWARYVYAAVLRLWRAKLIERHQGGMKDVPNIDALVEELSLALKDKRAFDTDAILDCYRSRVSANNRLGNKNLLRLKGRAGGVPKASLRQIFSRGREEMREVMPLLLLSPETASSMLPLTAGLFDLVIIDEASQMFVAEAMPMLFRGKNVIIAGDTQQMPPSDFFAYSEAEEEDDLDDNERAENDLPEAFVAADGIYRLLDAAEEALPRQSLCRLKLNVHYRSERKELIEFSNHAFYEGGLIVPAGNAPLPPFMQTAIEFENVNGDFVRGTNQKEALRVVELLRSICLSSIKPHPTLGVIVANVKQRDLVLELLQEAADQDAAFQAAYERERSRHVADEDMSLFVRSVEHIQGDERDLIIFGLTYSGSSRSYGPLAKKDDGRKRLNVAITRAKRGMIVLNSLTISHISNESEKDTHERYYVWQYLRYTRAIAQQNHAQVETILSQLNEKRESARTSEDQTESPFEADVKLYIESLGFYVACQVGESGFRIDLGVRETRSSSEYLCGIECDGARYHSGWRARTHDVWRQEVLEAKGWKISRVWSTEWFENPDAARRKLAAKLRDYKSQAGVKAQADKMQFIHRESINESNGDSFDAIGCGIDSLNKKTETIHPTLNALVTPHVFTPIQLPLESEASAKEIEVGDTVEYEFLDGDRSGSRSSARIVNGQSAPNDGSINKQTPLAKSLLEAGYEGEECIFRSLAGEVRLKVLSVVKPVN